MSGVSQANENQGLNESEARYRALVTATSDVVYRMSPDWSIMHQLEGRGFLSDSKEPITHWLKKYVHVLDQRRVYDAIDKAIREKSMFQLEHRVLRADGTIGWSSSKAIPILDENGNIVEWFGAASDVTDRKKMEEALQEARDIAEQQKRLYETVTANTPDLIYVFDLDYRFIYANTALLNMWGKTWDNAIGRSLLENGYEPWHAEMHEREIDHIIATKQPIRGEVAFPHATLGRRIYDYIFSPVINSLGQVIAIAGTTRDISEIKENEQRKNDFISMVSHELKTPLTSAISYVQLAQRRALSSGDEMAANMLERADKQHAKMTRMINGFLNVSRLESGKMQIDRRRFDLAKLVKEVEEETQSYVTTHPVTFEFCPAIFVDADREKIGQVFNNLISNAVKYSHAGKPITVSCSAGENEVTVSVHDEGIGVDQEDLPRLFERYYRVKEAETNNIAGFGIGLYLCSEIIKRHNGEIGVKSEPGKGSTFYFTLPLAQS